MKLLKKHKEILNELIKGKGYFKTPTVPKNHQENILDDLVNLYLKDYLCLIENMTCHHLVLVVNTR